MAIRAESVGLPDTEWPTRTVFHRVENSNIVFARSRNLLLPRFLRASKAARPETPAAGRKISTTPASIHSAEVSALRRFLVTNPAERPYAIPLASSFASRRWFAGKAPMTGPQIPSSAMRISLETSPKTAGAAK